jgi:hypothetical protein
MLLFRPLIVGVHHAKKFWMPGPRTAIECAKQKIHCLLRGAVDATLDYGLLLGSNVCRSVRTAWRRLQRLPRSGRRFLLAIEHLAATGGQPAGDWGL